MFTRQGYRENAHYRKEQINLFTHKSQNELIDKTGMFTHRGTIYRRSPGWWLVYEEITGSPQGGHDILNKVGCADQMELQKTMRRRKR
jgi:hypothetical protein